MTERELDHEIDVIEMWEILGYFDATSRAEAAEWLDLILPTLKKSEIRILKRYLESLKADRPYTPEVPS